MPNGGRVRKPVTKSLPLNGNVLVYKTWIRYVYIFKEYRIENKKEMLNDIHSLKYN